MATHFSSSTAQPQTLNLRIIETTDVHGSFFPYDFITRKPRRGSMARVCTYVDSVRQKYGENVILLENGDILQGQPTCYYYNYIHPELPNIASDIVNFMHYDAQALGNHDVETGHAVYDKWMKEIVCPKLGANIIDTKTGRPYVHPYTIIERQGARIAVLGMLTPAIPNWLNETLWSGLHFDDMVASARYWVDYIKKNEHPDVLIGLFHSGREGGITTPEYVEDASLEVAREIPGFDIIMFGHDHARYNKTVTNVEGQEVLCINPANNANFVADVALTLTKDNNSWKVTKKHGILADVRDLGVNAAYMKRFQSSIDSVNHYVDQVIGRFDTPLYVRDCFFGNAAFTDFVHNLQLKITGADISFNAPLGFDNVINTGEVTIADMFNLYRYENQMFIVKLTGEEIRKHLEMSYDLWVNTMKSPDDHIIQMEVIDKNGSQVSPTNDVMPENATYGFKNFSFNFESAAGIDYEVDVTKPDGQKVRILRFSDGRPFDPKATYKVAMNSYRANGGGELLTRGAGLSKEEIQKRIIFQSEKDQRYYLMQEIQRMGHAAPKANSNWKFVPENWAKPALARDRALIFK